MLSKIILAHLFRLALVVIPAAAIILFFVTNIEDALGVLAGGILAASSGAALIYIVGILLDPLKSSTTKSAFMLVLLLKLVAVVGLLWAIVSIFRLGALGLIIGVSTGLFCVVFAANRGSTSPEGQRAIAESEQQIREEMGDTDVESR